MSKTFLTMLLIFSLAVISCGSDKKVSETDQDLGGTLHLDENAKPASDSDTAISTEDKDTSLPDKVAVDEIVADADEVVVDETVLDADEAVVDETVLDADEAAADETFVMIHFEAGYKGRLDNNLPINIPAEYMTDDFGWQEYLFDTAEKLVQKANDYGFHLTLAFNPQWAEYILLDNTKTNTVKKWQEDGHEIAFHHHSVNHPDWNGYSNDQNALNNPVPFLGDVDAGLDFVKNLAAPINVTTAMIGGLPIDMPQSYENSTESLNFAGGNQYSSFEQYGELRSLKPHKIIKNNGAEITYVTHRELTAVLKDFTVDEALEIFKTEYSNIQSDEIYGIVFHCFDYYETAEAYNDWFEFVKNRGDNIKTISEVISGYEYEIPVE